MTISKFLEYLQYEKKYAPHTLKAYQNDLIDFQSFFKLQTNSLEIRKASKIEIRNFIIELTNSTLSKRTINRKISSLKSYYKFLMKIGELDNSPIASIKLLKQYNESKIPFSEAELNQLLDDTIYFDSTYSGTRDRLIIELFYQTGIRRSELIRLTYENFNKDQKWIKVVGKRNKERIIPISDQLVKKILDFFQCRSEVFPEIKEPMFLTDKGKPMYDKLVYNIVNKYLSKVSTKHKKSPHILRHSFATHLLDRGAEINTIKEMMGHSSLAATQVYTHGSIENLKKVFNKAHPREHKN